MQANLLPLFPLQLVLFPHTPLPLHIFEERYKEMMGEIRKTNSEFGVVQAGEKGIVNTGCSATIERVIQDYDDGRMDLLAIGRRRFEIMSLNDDKPYLRAEIQFFDDDDPASGPEDLQQKAIAGFDQLRELEGVEVIGTPKPGDPQLSFQLAQLVPDLDFRQVLLATRSEAERIKALAMFFPQYLERQRYTAQMKALSRRNGHGHRKVEAD
jgi:ATP-dependent Lon protease